MVRTLSVAKGKSRKGLPCHRLYPPLMVSSSSMPTSAISACTTGGITPRLRPDAMAMSVPVALSAFRAGATDDGTWLVSLMYKVSSMSKKTIFGRGMWGSWVVWLIYFLKKLFNRINTTNSTITPTVQPTALLIGAIKSATSW